MDFKATRNQAKKRWEIRGACGRLVYARGLTKRAYRNVHWNLHRHTIGCWLCRFLRQFPGQADTVGRQVTIFDSRQTNAISSGVLPF